MSNPIRTAVAALALSAPLLGCATAGSGRAPAPDPHTLRVADGRSGLAMDWDALVARAAAADAVLIGEIHSNPGVLAFEAALADDLLARKPNSFALSLEFLGRDAQVDLDDLRASLTTPDQTETLAKLPPAHRDAALTTLSADRPVIASNAPRRYVKLARTGGRDAMAGLTDEQQRLFDMPDSMTGGAYRDAFFEMMSGMPSHGGADPDAEPLTPEEQAEAEAAQQAMIDGYYLAQNVWDATMAASIARAMDAGGQPVLHVVGRFHVDQRGGLTERLLALRPRAHVLTISFVPAGEEPEEEQADVLVYLEE